MKKFSLEEYLAHPEKKVVTRDGESVRIICCAGPSKQFPIVAFAGDDHTPYCWSTDGSFLNEPSGMDLFIVEPEPELTEFEKEVSSAMQKHGLLDCGAADRIGRNCAKELLDLARKEITDGLVWISPDELNRQVDQARNIGKAEALKDLPRWKKIGRGSNYSSKTKFVINGRYLEMNDTLNDVYEVALSELEKLPKEE